MGKRFLIQDRILTRDVHWIKVFAVIIMSCVKIKGTSSHPPFPLLSNNTQHSHHVVWFHVTFVMIINYSETYTNYYSCNITSCTCVHASM